MLRRLFLICILWKLNAACISNCTCAADNKGRNAVICKEGGIIGPLTLEGLDRNTEVLIISAPDNNMNSLTMVPAFGEFRQLEEIHITHSNIPQLGDYFFFGLTNLSVLNLSHNNITQVIGRNFVGLGKLRELSLDDNSIISLPSSTFGALKELRVLSIQRNRINELMHSVFLHLTKLRVVKLSGNPLRELQMDAFRDVKELRSLECRGCALTEMNAQIYPLLSHLNHLDLGQNEITDLQFNDFENLKSLRHLRLDSNKISRLNNRTFAHLSELRKLTLAKNHISTISDTAFENLDNLTELDLSHNKIKSLNPNVFDSILENLLILSLSGNNINLSSFKPLFSKLKVRELKLRQCELLSITENIFPPTLISMDLSHNHLTFLDGNALPDNLYFLDLSKNKLRGIQNDDLLDKIEMINVTLLDGNPWSCDLCYIIPLINRMNRSSTFQNIICSQPYVVEGKRLETLDRNQLTWCTMANYGTNGANFFSINKKGSIGIIAATMSVLLLSLILIIILGMLCYSKRHAARYYTHEEKLAPEFDPSYENHSPLFEDGELHFKFPLESNVGNKKISIATIDGMKKENKITNGA